MNPKKILLSLFTLGVLPMVCAVSASAKVIPYPRVPSDQADTDYISVKVNGVPVDTVATDVGVGYTHFAFAGPVKVEITAKEPIREFDLSPHRLGIKAEKNGSVLSFELTEPRKLHLRINNLPRFFIFADPPEADPPQPGQSGVFSLADFGVKSSPDLTQTAEIQKALNEVSARKGVLYVPPGVYRTGRLDIGSNITVYLAPGALLKGTGKIADYPKGRNGTQQIQLLDAENVKIIGRGVIDGNGQALRRGDNNSSASRARLINMFSSKNVVMEDVILRGAGVWCVHPIESEHLRFSNLKLISLTRAEFSGAESKETPFLGSNTDGFDPDNSSHVVIENNFISVDDDAIAVKLTRGQRRDMTDIQFRGNVIWIMCSALKIGTEVNDKTLTNVVFENNDIVHADVGIAVWCWRGGTVDGAKWINNYFENIGTVKNDSPHKKETNIRLTIRDVEGKGHITNMLMKDNTFERFAPNDSLLQGLDPEHIIDGVTIENLVIAGKRRLNPDDARLTVGRFVENFKME